FPYRGYFAVFPPLYIFKVIGTDLNLLSKAKTRYENSRCGQKYQGKRWLQHHVYRVIAISSGVEMYKLYK
ncbi:MAG: hypothetical protein WAU25_13585, partial [Nitrososphaeraceae archaeon]